MKTLTRAALQALFAGFAYFCLFTPFYPSETLLTLLRPSTGFISLAIAYFAYGLGCLISPSVINALGPRLCVVISAITYPLFTGAQLLGIPWLCYLASPFVGLGAAHIWPSAGVYLSRLNQWTLRQAAAVLPSAQIKNPLRESVAAASAASSPSSSAAAPADAPPSGNAPPAPLSTAERRRLKRETDPSNMSFLSGLFYCCANCSNVGGFIIATFLITDFEKMFLILFILGLCGVFVLCFIPPVPAVARASSSSSTSAAASSQPDPDADPALASLGTSIDDELMSRGSHAMRAPPIPPPPRAPEPPPSREDRSWCRILWDSMIVIGRLLATPEILLFELTFVFYGMSYSFFFGSLPPQISAIQFVSPALICRGLMCVLVSPLLGRLADRIGRFQVLFILYAVAGCALVVVTVAVYMHPATDWLFLVAYFLYGCFEGGTRTLAYSTLAWVCAEKAEAFVLWDVLQALNTAVMFLLGSSVTFFAMSVVVWALWLVGLMALVAMVFRVRFIRRKRKAASAPVSL